jgi:hypothetical protein
MEKPGIKSSFLTLVCDLDFVVKRFKNYDGTNSANFSELVNFKLVI